MKKEGAGVVVRANAAQVKGEGGRNECAGADVVFFFLFFLILIVLNRKCQNRLG